MSDRPALKSSGVLRPSPDELQQRFEAHFPGAPIEIQDDSHLHAGHAGSAGGAGHYTVRIVSSAFAGLNRVARHRLVYDPVRPWLPHRVHALVIHALTPDEAEALSRKRP